MRCGAIFDRHTIELPYPRCCVLRRYCHRVKRKISEIRIIRGKKQFEKFVSIRGKKEV